MDLIYKAGEVAGDVADKISDTVSGVFEGIKETTDSVLHPIDSLLGSWGSDLLEASMKIAESVI